MVDGSSTKGVIFDIIRGNPSGTLCTSTSKLTSLHGDLAACKRLLLWWMVYPEETTRWIVELKFIALNKSTYLYRERSSNPK